MWTFHCGYDQLRLVVVIAWKAAVSWPQVLSGQSYDEKVGPARWCGCHRCICCSWCIIVVVYWMLLLYWLFWIIMIESGLIYCIYWSFGFYSTSYIGFEWLIMVDSAYISLGCNGQIGLQWVHFVGLQWSCLVVIWWLSKYDLRCSHSGYNKWCVEQAIK